MRFISVFDGRLLVFQFVMVLIYVFFLYRFVKLLFYFGKFIQFSLKMFVKG